VGKITSIKPQKNKKRVNVFIDNKYAFAMPLETYVKSKIKVGDELTATQQTRVANKATTRTLYNALLNYSSLRPRSEYEINSWLKKKGIPSKTSNKFKSKLINLQLLNDHKFATWWINQRNEFRPRSMKHLRSELLAKRINLSIIKEALQETKVDEISSAKKLFIKKSKQLAKLDPKTRQRKIIQYLEAKGFSYETVSKLIDHLRPSE